MVPRARNARGLWNPYVLADPPCVQQVRLPKIVTFRRGDATARAGIGPLAKTRRRTNTGSRQRRSVGVVIALRERGTVKRPLDHGRPASSPPLLKSLLLRDLEEELAFAAGSNHQLLTVVRRLWDGQLSFCRSGTFIHMSIIIVFYIQWPIMLFFHSFLWFASLVMSS